MKETKPRSVFSIDYLELLRFMSSWVLAKGTSPAWFRWTPNKGIEFELRSGPACNWPRFKVAVPDLAPDIWIEANTLNSQRKAYFWYGKDNSLTIAIEK